MATQVCKNLFLCSNPCCEKVVQSHWLDVALVVGFLFCLAVGLLATAGVLDFIGPSAASYLSYGMYGADALLFFLAIVSIKALRQVHPQETLTKTTLLESEVVKTDSVISVKPVKAIEVVEEKSEINVVYIEADKTPFTPLFLARCPQASHIEFFDFSSDMQIFKDQVHNRNGTVFIYQFSATQVLDPLHINRIEALKSLSEKVRVVAITCLVEGKYEKQKFSDNPAQIPHAFFQYSKEPVGNNYAQWQLTGNSNNVDYVIEEINKLKQHIIENKVMHSAYSYIS